MELLEENTGGNFSRRRITRRRPGHESASPPAPSSSKHRNVVESSDEDLDDDDNFPRVQDIHNIWDDERGGGRDDDDDDVDMDDMDNFIEYEDEEDGGVEAQRARKEHMKKRKAMRRAMGSRPELAGIDAKWVILLLYRLLILTLFVKCMGRDS